MSDRIEKSEEQWLQELGPELYPVLREKGTERPFSGALLDNKESGTYRCAACGESLFASDSKYDSGSGWPSFYAPVEEERVAAEEDSSHGMIRTEALCARCGSHLGHVFPDGPQPTGLRYCVNSLSLDFQPDGEGADPSGDGGGTGEAGAGVREDQEEAP